MFRLGIVLDEPLPYVLKPVQNVHFLPFEVPDLMDFAIAFMFGIVPLARSTTPEKERDSVLS